MVVEVWEPLRRLEEFDKVISGLFTQPGAAPGDSAVRPAADYGADAEGYLVSVDLPGVNKEDVDISVEGDVLKVRAQRKPRVENQNAENVYQSYVREIRSGRLQRTFRLAKDADAAAVTASLANGVLEVRVPKRREAKPRKVEISS